MHEIHGDQAAGLRRLVARGGMRMLAFAAGCRGAGGTTAVANIAAALAVAGQQVLAIDEHGGMAGVAELLGARVGAELQATRRECAPEDMLLRGACGVTVLPALYAGHGRAGLHRDYDARAQDEYARLGERFDITLIDTRETRHAGALSAMADDVVLVASAAAAALTGAYGLIKRSAARHEHKRFHILVNGVETAAVAQIVFGNLERAARDYLDLPLASLGWVPRDAAVQAAALRNQPVVTALPGAPAARGFGNVASSIAGWPHRHAQYGTRGIAAPRAAAGISGVNHASI